MTRKILSIILIIVLAFALGGCGNKKVKQLTTEEKIQDFEYLFTEMENSYPFMEVNKRVNGVNWVANKDDYLERIKNTKNDEEFIEELSKIVSELNNSHTQVIDNKEMFQLMKSILKEYNLYNFFDNPVVVERYTNIKNKKMKKELSKESLILEDVVKDKVGYIYIPQMMPRGKSIDEDISTIEAYTETLENHQALIIDIRGNGGGNDSYWAETLMRVIDKQVDHNSYVLFKDGQLLKDYINKTGVSDILKPIDELPQDILKNAPKDITETFNSFFEGNMKLFASYNSKFKGDLYLLIDDKVYSSAEAMAVFCKDTKIATLIGEKTAGDGCGVTPMLFDLKNSGLVVRMSACLLLTQDGFCNEEYKTTPDYIIEDTTRTKDFNEDNCINKVLELEGIK